MRSCRIIFRYMEIRIHIFWVGCQVVVTLWYQCIVLLEFDIEISLFIERTDYLSNLAKTILFENCSCFSKIPFSISVESPRIFQCIITIPAGHWVRQIDGDLPAIGNQFCVQICYMFLISKCRGDWDLGLCTTSVLALGEPMRNGKIRGKNVFRRRKNRILPLQFGSPSARTEVVHRPRSQSPLHFDIENI